VVEKAGAGAGLAGEVQVSEALRGSSGRGTLYVMVRNAGVPGPPVAVKRIPDPSFPVRFEIGSADVMMQGTPLVGPFELSARLDQDGNPMTKSGGDLVTKGGLSGVPVGAGALVLVLDEKL
jgi:cytochrome c-type biogenesis protein CcmH